MRVPARPDAAIFHREYSRVHLSRMKEQIMTLMADSNLLNKKSKMEELGALLDKYVPASEAMRTKLKKYDKAYRRAFR